MAGINLDNAVNDILSEFSADVTKAAQEAVAEVSKEAVKKLKQTAPRGRTGKYSRGWTSRVEKTTTTAESTIYGKTGTYQLAHLLEHGHAKRNGGRVPGKAHIAPAEQDGIEELEREIERSIRNG